MENLQTFDYVSFQIKRYLNAKAWIMRRPLFRTLTSTGCVGHKLTLGHSATHSHSSLLQSSMLLQRVSSNWEQLKTTSTRGILIAKMLIWNLLHFIPPIINWHETEKYCFHLPLLPLPLPHLYKQSSAVCPLCSSVSPGPVSTKWCLLHCWFISDKDQ